MLCRCCCTRAWHRVVLRRMKCWIREHAHGCLRTNAVHCACPFLKLMIVLFILLIFLLLPRAVFLFVFLCLFLILLSSFPWRGGAKRIADMSVCVMVWQWFLCAWHGVA